MEDLQTHQKSFPKGNEYIHPSQQNLPNSTTVLVLGILSIVFSSWYFSIAGIILGIIALVLAQKDLLLFHAEKSRYTLSSYNNLKAGRICAIIGLVVAIIFFIIFILILFGIFITWPFWGMID
jgi:magnesium-transporting ATPase (P-type)